MELSKSTLNGLLRDPGVKVTSAPKGVCFATWRCRASMAWSGSLPGIPAVLPGERINQRVLDYLRSGAEAGMVLPDPADPGLETIRVVAHQRDS